MLASLSLSLLWFFSFSLHSYYRMVSQSVGSSFFRRPDGTPSPGFSTYSTAPRSSSKSIVYHRLFFDWSDLDLGREDWRLIWFGLSSFLCGIGDMTRSVFSLFSSLSTLSLVYDVIDGSFYDESTVLSATLVWTIHWNGGAGICSTLRGILARSHVEGLTTRREGVNWAE